MIPLIPTDWKRSVMLFAIVLALVLLVIENRFVYSSNPGVEVYPIDSRPFGKSMEDWSTVWWNWLLPIPQNDSPARDDTGKNCAVGQNNPDVWFLAQTGSGPAERSCKIPAGTSILFPVAINECSYAEAPTIKSEEELSKCARSGNEVTSIRAVVDGIPIENLTGSRVSSGLFNTTLPHNNIFGVPGCPCHTQAVSDAYMVFLEPLSPGKHTLVWEQLTSANPTTGTEGFGYKVTYNLEVIPASD
jgi:hypothetical protein